MKGFDKRPNNNMGCHWELHLFSLKELRVPVCQRKRKCCLKSHLPSGLFRSMSYFWFFQLPHQTSWSSQHLWTCLCFPNFTSTHFFSHTGSLHCLFQLLLNWPICFLFTFLQPIIHRAARVNLWKGKWKLAFLPPSPSVASRCTQNRTRTPGSVDFLILQPRF